jgi:hypothetical protein
MKTDDGRYFAAQAYYWNVDSANVTQTASQGWFWAEPWTTWECEAEPRRYAQPALLFLPLALLVRLWRWLKATARPT